MNLLVVLADQWRGAEQGWLGGSAVRTPHLDALAERGVAVRGAFANAPVCGPSRATLLTGLLPHEHHVVANDLPLRTGIPTLADVLAGAGYRTGWIGKWHLDGLPRDKWVAPERRRGFGYWASSNCTHDYVDAHYWTGDEQPVRVQTRGYEPEAQTDLALEFLAEPDERPFFLTVSYGPPHDPYEVPDRYLAAYGDEPLRDYLAGITAIDAQLGRLLEAVGDDTLVVVTSDHGDMLGAHGLRAKQVPYEESIHVPLVLCWPGRLEPGARPDGLIGLVDLPPTLLGLLGAPALPGAHGRDLSGPLRDGGRLLDAVPLGNWVSCDEGHRQGVPEWRGFRTETITYARRAGGEPWLLYALDADPAQQANLVGDAALVRAADARLDALLADAGDPAAPGFDTLRQLGVVDAWNARERELHGDAARLVPAA